MLAPMLAALVFEAIDPAVAQGLRDAATARVRADAKPGYPCRQCLRDAEVGDELVLVAHDPFGPRSPYTGPTAIYLHATPCEPHQRSDEAPDLLLARPLSLRLYDGTNMMRAAALASGDELYATARELLATLPDGTVHVHNAAPGCWNCTIRLLTDA